MAKEMKALTINGETYEIVDEYARSHSGSGSSAELEDIRIGADGKKFGTAGEAVRQQFRYVGEQIDHIEEEIQNVDSVFEDICYDSDGYKYPTPGDTIRMQFDSVKYAMENIDESIDHVMDVFGIVQEEIYDARLDADGVEYETVGEAVREQFKELANNFMREVTVTLEESQIKKAIYTIGITVGQDVSNLYIYDAEQTFVNITEVKKNDIVKIVDEIVLSIHNADSDRIIFTDNNHIARNELFFDTIIKNNYEFKVPNDGYMYLCGKYESETTELFTIKRIVDFVESPKNTKVGQMLVVKTVNENGDPVEWKTAAPLSEEVSELDRRLNEISESFSKNIMKGITLNDVTEKNTRFKNISGRNLDTNVGEVISNVIELYPDNDHCAYIQNVKKGDSFVKSKKLVLSSDVAYLIVTAPRDDEEVIIDIVYFDDIEEKYTFTENGRMYICFLYENSPAEEFFYIESKVFYVESKDNSPIVLNDDNADLYLNDPTYGDNVLDAILSGRQVLVKTPNADGKNFTAIYSPIYMYQLPNYENNYLYLFYLKDDKQNIDLSALGLGTIQMPLYGELKLLLSETYNETPLE